MSFAEFPKALYWDLNIFINDIFLVFENSDISNFAYDSTLYSHSSNIPLILSNLEPELKWFKINSLKANPAKFQFVILGKKNHLKYSQKIGSITVKESDEVELLGITIDKVLNFRKHRKFMSPYPVQTSWF